MGVPSNIILPFVGVSFDSSQAFSGPAVMPVTALLIGQANSGASITNDEPVLVSNADQVGGIAGYGSTLHRMAKKWYTNNNSTTLYVAALTDGGGATAAETDLTVTGPATASGEIDLYIDGDRYAIAVAKDATATDIGDDIVTAISDNPAAPVTAVNTAGVVTLTAKNPGIAAGDVDIRINYNSGEQLPAGIGLTIGSTTPGTVDPDVTTLLTNLGDMWINIMAGLYYDNTNMSAIEDYLEDLAGPIKQRDGIYYTAIKGTKTDIINATSSSDRNSPYSVMNVATNQPSSIAEIASGVAALTAFSITEDPAVPLHRMRLAGFLPAVVQDRFNLTDRNQLAENGAATLTNDNGVQTEATVTTYLKNSAGAADVAYQYQNTVFILMRLRYRFVNRILTKYPRAKLANSTERIGSGQQVITPDIGKAEAVAWFLQEERDGQVEGIEQFKNELVCQRSESNVNRLEWILPPDLINQFIVGSGTMQFRLD